MKIGTCVNFSEIDGMEKKFAQLREHNFDSCQLVSWNPAAWTDENASILKTLLEQYQITVSAFWCGWTAWECDLVLSAGVFESVSVFCGDWDDRYGVDGRGTENHAGGFSGKPYVGAAGAGKAG